MLYDSKNGTVLGRNCLSWTKILAFYIVYYAFLAVLFWGTVQLFAGRAKQVTVETSDEKTYSKYVGKPYIYTRTDQPGMDVWPHQMTLDDDLGQNMKLNMVPDNKDPYGNKPKDNRERQNAYTTLVTKYLLDACPYEKSCKFADWYGSNWATTMGLDFIEPGVQDVTDQQKKTTRQQTAYRLCPKKPGTQDPDCGKIMSINWTKFRAKLNVNETDNKIESPIFFLAINKVIDFQLKSAKDLNKIKGPPLQYEVKNRVTDAVYFNCFIKDNLVSKGIKRTPCCTNDTADDNVKCIPISEEGCKEGEKNVKERNTYQQKGTKYSIKAILPYIKNEHYEYNGYKANSEGLPEIDEQNMKSMNYVKPFAIFQMNSADGLYDSKAENMFIRCNALAANIEYPYLDSDQLSANALLMQAGHGHIEFGFQTAGQG